MSYEGCVCGGGGVPKNSEPQPLSFRVQIFITWGAVNYKLRERDHSLEVFRNLQKETLWQVDPLAQSS